MKIIHQIQNPNAAVGNDDFTSVFPIRHAFITNPSSSSSAGSGSGIIIEPHILNVLHWLLNYFHSLYLGLSNSCDDYKNIVHGRVIPGLKAAMANVQYLQTTFTTNPDRIIYDAFENALPQGWQPAEDLTTAVAQVRNLVRKFCQGRATWLPTWTSDVCDQEWEEFEDNLKTVYRCVLELEEMLDGKTRVGWVFDCDGDGGDESGEEPEEEFGK